jgi:hypothetical protein
MMSYPNGVILVQISQQGCLSWPILVSDWFNFEEILIKEGLENWNHINYRCWVFTKLV